MKPQDLHLLVVFDAIMTEGSITAAADRLAMTQPAVSNAVSRMRVAWKDELFVRDGRRVQPTAYAKNLWAAVREPMHSISETLEPKVFQSGEAKRTFRIATSDGVVDLGWQRLRAVIEREARGINIFTVPYNFVNAEQLLNSAEVDMVVGQVDTQSDRHLHENLYKSHYICVMRKGHPLAGKKMTLKRFAEAEHLLVSLSGDTTGFSDRALAKEGLTRRIAMTINHFSAAASLMINSDMIAVIPSVSVDKELRSGELIAMRPPVDIPVGSINIIWHQRQSNDQGLVWIRQQLKAILSEEMEKHLELIGNLI